MVYLVKVIHLNSVASFYSENDMKVAGFSTADKIVTDEEFNSNGCYARIIDGEIVVGKTQAEKDEEERLEKIAGYKAELGELDRKYLTTRVLAGLSKNDAYSIAQFEEHESLAVPIRELLAPLLTA